MGFTCTSSALLLDGSALFTTQSRATPFHRILKSRLEAHHFNYTAKVDSLKIRIVTKAFEPRHAFPSLRCDVLLDGGNGGNYNDNNNGGGNNNDNNGSDGDGDNGESNGLNLRILAIFWSYCLTSLFTSQVCDGHGNMVKDSFLPRQLVVGLLSLLGLLGLFHMDFARAIGRTGESDQEMNDGEAVWEIKGSKRTKIIPDPSKDEFVVVPSSFLTPSGSSRKENMDSGVLGPLSCLPSLWLLSKDIVFRLMLPEGFPDSVTSDYLDYSLWRGVQGIASQITGVLATQVSVFLVCLLIVAMFLSLTVEWGIDLAKLTL